MELLKECFHHSDMTYALWIKAQTYKKHTCTHICTPIILFLIVREIRQVSHNQNELIGTTGQWRECIVSPCRFERNCTPSCSRKFYLSQSSTVGSAYKCKSLNCVNVHKQHVLCAINYATYPLVLKWQIIQFYRYSILLI